MIDGREEIKGHGTSDMPIWGQVFRMEAGTSAMAQSQVRGRILELVHYLNRTTQDSYTSSLAVAS